MSEPKGRGRLSRRQLVGAAAAAVPAVMAARAGLRFGPGLAYGRPKNLRGMNVVMFVSDQERALQHFPRGWGWRNLPGMSRLRRRGVTFTNAFTNSCMCSPARSTLLTGYFPAQHGVKYTLELDMPADQYPQVELPLDLPNIASVMSAAGYNVVWKGKWHLSKPEGQDWAPSDVGKYGFGRWNPPDAGANQDLPEAGGGNADNDGRFMKSIGDPEAGDEGALQYLRSQAAKDQPFFMVISLVNPHDVLFYPRTYEDAGYDEKWLRGRVGLPATVDEDLSTKPSVQEQFRRIFDLSGKPRTPRQKREYINFYANLMRSTDRYLVRVLDTLRATGLLEDTLFIRTSDHGEMGLAHGGLRQKNFNFYEESLRVPLIYSNPKLFRRRRTSDALVSHVDFLPTLAGLFDAPRGARADWQGVDYSQNVLWPRTPTPQNYVAFTYDDFQSGQANGPYPRPPNHIISIRERRYKLAKYYDVERNERPQWELYDLKSDPLEQNNLARRGAGRTPHQRRQFRRLRRRLKLVRRRRLSKLFR